MQHPAELSDPTWNYAVLGLAFVAETISFGIALREFLHIKGADAFWKAILTSKDPAIFIQDMLIEQKSDKEVEERHKLRDPTSPKKEQ